MSEWKFLTADEIVKWYGERCSDTEPGCPTCAAWLRYDTLRQWEYEAVNERIDAEMNERLSYYSPEFVFDPAIHTIDAFVPPRSLEIAAKKMFTRLMLERKIGDQDPDPYAGSEWAGGREG